MRKMRSAVSLLLSIVLVLGLLPLQSYAEECQHQLAYSVEGDCITESCTNEGCSHKGTATVVLDDAIPLTYTGKEIKPLKVQYSEGWKGEKPEIKYVNNVTVTVVPEEAPSETQKTETQNPEEQIQLTGEVSQTENEELPATDEDAQKKTEEEKKELEEKIPTGTLKIGDASITKTFAIGKGKLTVTATATAVYGDEKPQYTLVCEDIEGNLVEGVITATEEMLTSSYTSEAKAGDPFDIVVNLEGVSSENYELYPENGSFVVGKRKVELAVDAPEYTYDGQPHTPKIIVKNLVGEDNVEVDYEEVSQTAADTYEIPVKGFKGDDAVLANYELPSETQKTFVVAQREVTLTAEPSTYNGEKHTPKVVVGKLVEGEQLDAVYDATPKTEVGEYNIAVTGLKATANNNANPNNYKLPDNPVVTFTIQKAASNMPETVKAEAETIFGKNDGKITGVDTTMEYCIKDADSYTAVTGEKITGLKPGTYWVRYAGDENHDPAVYEVAAGSKLTITLPDSQDSYSVVADKREAGWNDTVTLTVTIHENFEKTTDFAVKANDVALTEKDGKYIVEKIQDDVEVTVEGLSPRITMTLLEESYHVVQEEVSFSQYLKQEATLEIAAPSGILIEYAEMTAKTELKDIQESDWKDYDSTKTLKVPSEEGNAVFYARVSKDGTVYYASTNGVVLDKSAPKFEVGGKLISIPSNGAAVTLDCYTTQEIKVTDANLEVVRVNGVSKTSPISLKGNEEKVYLVRAEDKAGNKNQINIKMHPIASLKEPIKDLKTTTMKAEDKDDVTAVLDKVKALPTTTEKTEKDAIEAVKKFCEDLLKSVNYTITTETDDLKWTKSSGKTLVIKTDAKGVELTDLKIGGTTVTDSTTNYTYDKATGTLTLKSALLQKTTYKVGKHKIQLIFEDGKTSGADQIEILKAGTNPKTGDNGILFWTTASFLSMACLAVILPTKKKNNPA